MRNDLLITVTSFFRDAAAWQVLESEVLPKLLLATDSGEAIRIWVTACATGEEAYSLAIAMRETQDAIRKVLQGAKTVALGPQASDVRRRQHELVRQSDLISHSYGEEPNRRVRIYRQ